MNRKDNRKVVTTICKSKTSNKYLLILQARVPVDRTVLEFPAGLVDENETIENAALRELKEETGYEGKIIKISSEIPKSPGLSNESTYVVEILIDEDTVQSPNLQETEEIQLIWMSPDEFELYAAQIDPTKNLIDGLVWFYFRGFLDNKK